MDSQRILGLVLAGGLSRRMGVDKAFVTLAGRPLVAHALDRLRAQCAGVAINSNGDAARFAAFGVPVVADGVKGFPGPLAGVLAGLDYAGRNGFDAVVTLPVDTPLAPDDLVARLVAASGAASGATSGAASGATSGAAKIAVAASGGQAHHAVALWSTSLAQDVRRALEVEGERGVARFAARYDPAIVEWPVGGLDPFFNINAPDDLAVAARALSG